MEKFEDWPSKLNVFFEENRSRKFERGVFDCAVFAGLAIEATTGHNFIKNYVGKYKTKKQGFEMLKNEGLKTLIDLAEKCLGKALPSVKMATRGDIIAVKYENELALAVVDLSGRRCVTTGKEGLIFFNPDKWLKAWRV